MIDLWRNGVYTRVTYRKTKWFRSETNLITLDIPDDDEQGNVTDRMENLRLGRIYALRKDNNEILRRLWILRMLMRRGDWADYKTIRYRALELEAIFKKHVSDVETTLFREGGDPMTTVFQEHKSIQAGFENLHLSLLQEGILETRLANFQKFDELITKHMNYENEKTFPLLINEIHLQDMKQGQDIRNAIVVA